MEKNMRLASILAAAAMVLCLGQGASADLTWYGDGALPGGPGTWDAVAPNWSPDGTTFQTWANGENAIFETAGGIVSLDSAVTLGNLTFSADGYSIVGTLPENTLSFDADKTITTDSNAAISAVITGNGFTKAGLGALTLSGENTLTGGTILSAGTLNLNNAAALGTTNAALVINGGSLGNTSGTDITLAGNRAVTVNGDFGFSGTNALN
ncbi:MAG: hypothetical protein EHM48_06950, partial [Planctomycetaceae bacterium]